MRTFFAALSAALALSAPTALAQDAAPADGAGGIDAAISSVVAPVSDFIGGIVF